MLFESPDARRSRLARPAANQLHALVVTALGEPRSSVRKLGITALVVTAGQWRPDLP